MTKRSRHTNTKLEIYKTKRTRVQIQIEPNNEKFIHKKKSYLQPAATETLSLNSTYNRVTSNK